MRKLCIHGKLLCKSSSISHIEDTRAILPLPTLAQVADAILGHWLRRQIDILASPSSELLWEGALPRRQCADIAHSMSLVVEKSLDDFSKGCLGQFDIRRYFDSLSPLAVAQHLERKGFSRSHLCAVLRLQCLLQITIISMGIEVMFNSRGSGSITGARTSGMLSRVPWVDAICNLKDLCHQCLWAAHGTRLPIMCWVDNAFYATRCLASTFALGSGIEAYLRGEWNLQIKPSSRLAMPVANAQLNCACLDGWVIDRSYPCLGFIIDAGSGLKPEVMAVKEALWKALWRNLKRRRSMLLPQQARIRIVERAILPVAQYRWTRWSPTPALAAHVDKIQRHMLTSCVICPPIPEESANTYVRRRGRIVTAAQNKVGKWSERLYSRVVKWAEHVDRDTAHPAHMLAKWHDEEWLQKKRLALLPMQSASQFGLLAGRTGTRRAAGIVHTKWEAGVRFAKLRIAELQPS